MVTPATSGLAEAVFLNEIMTPSRRNLQHSFGASEQAVLGENVVYTSDIQRCSALCLLCSVPKFLFFNTIRFRNGIELKLDRTCQIGASERSRAAQNHTYDFS